MGNINLHQRDTMWHMLSLLDVLVYLFIAILSLYCAYKLHCRWVAFSDEAEANKPEYNQESRKQDEWH